MDEQFVLEDFQPVYLAAGRRVEMHARVDRALHELEDCRRLSVQLPGQSD